jgi:alginate O-acetyltransferase complex protein AlgI
MFLGGLWHGASWNFVIWGMLHGGYLAIHKLITDRFPSIKNNWFFKSKIGKITSILITQYLVFLAWIPFRVRDVDSMLYSMNKYVLLDFQLESFKKTVVGNEVEIGIMVLFIFLNFISYKKNIQKIISEWRLLKWFLFLSSIILVILLFYAGSTDDFIYFRF